MELGQGLAALAFWGFITALVVAGVWDGARKREAQHETLRRMIEAGKPVDQVLMEKLVGDKKRRPDRDLRIGGIVVLSVAAGMVVLGAFVSLQDSRALMPLMGVAGLLACIGIGLFVASSYVRRTQVEDEALASKLPKAP